MALASSPEAYSLGFPAKRCRLDSDSIPSAIAIAFERCPDILDSHRRLAFLSFLTAHVFLFALAAMPYPPSAMKVHAQSCQIFSLASSIWYSCAL